MTNNSSDPQELTEPKYTLSVSRGHSGMDGDYATLDEAIDRLKDYGRSFPGQLIEAHITKIR